MNKDSVTLMIMGVAGMAIPLFIDLGKLLNLIVPILAGIVTYIGWKIR